MKIYIFKNGKLCPFCGLKKNRQVSTSFPICFSEKSVSKRASKNKNYVLQQLYSQLKVFALHLHRTGNHLLKVFLYFNLSVFSHSFLFFFYIFVAKPQTCLAFKIDARKCSRKRAEVRGKLQG